MPVLIPSGFGQAVLTLSSGFYTDLEAQIVTGHELPGTGSLGDAAVSVLAAYVDFLQPRLDPAVTIASVDFYTETSSGRATSAATGAGAGSYPPANQAVMVEKRTTLRGPRGRGRMFIPSIVTESEVDSFGMIAQAQFDAIQADAATFLADLATADVPMVLLHNSEGVSPPPAPTVVSSLLVDPQVATQRRRLRR